MTVEAIYSGGGKFPSAITTVHIGDGVYQFPEPTTAIKCNFIYPDALPLPTADPDDERVGFAEFNIDGAIARIPVRLYIQGSSSAHPSVAEKNWNMKFYKTLDDAKNDEDRAWIKIGKRNEMDKLIFKAWWVEATKAHAYMAFTIWDQMTKERKGYPKYEVDNWIVNQTKMPKNFFTGATGSCSVWATVFYVNDEFYGLGDTISTKDYYNYNLLKDPTDPNQLLWRGNVGSIKTLSNTSNSKDFEPSVPKAKKWDAARLAKVNRLVLFFLGSDTDFRNNIESYCDKQNLVDYVLFQQFTMDWDGVAENMMLTYDGNIWYFLPWDKDTTFGSGFKVGDYDPTKPDSGAGQKPGDDGEMEKDTATTGWRILQERTIRVFKPEMKERYLELKGKGILTVDNVMDLMKHHESLYSRVDRELDIQKWGETDGGYRTKFFSEGADRLLNWINLRIQTMEDYYDIE